MVFKYRAKRLSDGQWIRSETMLKVEDLANGTQGIFLPQRDDRCSITVDAVAGDITSMWFDRFYKVDAETVSACTGIQDNFGNVIFEGDIVSCVNTYLHTPEKEFYKVQWHEAGGGFYYVQGEILQTMNSWNEHCVLQVEGNIWDNPELSEKVKQYTVDSFDAEIREKFKQWEERKAQIVAEAEE